MRRTALAFGLAAFVIGLGALAWDLYGPTYSYSVCGIDSGGQGFCHSGTASLVQTGLTTTAAVFITIVGLLFAALATGSILAFFGRRTAGVTVLAVALGLLVPATLISGFSIGYSFLPSDALGVLALIFATRRRAPSSPPAT